MDQRTINAYNQDAAQISTFHASLIPLRLYELIQTYFIAQGKTLDAGCGIGRDSFFLQQNNFDVIGVDASQGMLEQAKTLYPSVRFLQDDLPSLQTLPDAAFDNVLCSAVLMHLDSVNFWQAMQRLLDLLKPDGVLIITLRGTQQLDQRENGKLYQAVNLTALRQFVVAQGAQLLHDEPEIEPQRQLIWQNLVVKKLPHPAE